MRSRCAPRGEQGFTLIEILVVILIIGVLAAIAVPSFLGQATTNGAPSKSLLRTAVLTAEAVALDNGYAAITKQRLHTYEPTIATAKGNGPWVSAASASANGYTLTVTSAIRRLSRSA